MRRFLQLALGGLAIVAGAGPAAAQTVVPPGNIHAEQPPIPGASTKRTKSARTTFEDKYRKIYKLLSTDGKLKAEIKEQAEAYGIDPIHIAGAIIGEHTYNVDAYDRLQTYYIKAVSYLSTDMRFADDGENVADFIQRPQFKACVGVLGSNALWNCRERVWNSAFRGQTVDDRTYPDQRFSAVFFQPFYAGQTFGIGQLSPLTALQMSDLVHRVSGFPKLDASDPNQVYETIMEPDLTLAYVAATLKTSIDAYRDIAGFDISHNPGITATLYNVGDPERRAQALRAENERRVTTGMQPRMPEENYYGWLVNEKLPELRALFDPV